MGPQCTNTLKAMCPNLEDSEKFYSNCSDRGWSAHGHASDGLMVRWVGVNLQIQRVWGPHAYGQHTSLVINFFHLEGVSVSQTTGLRLESGVNTQSQGMGSPALPVCGPLCRWAHRSHPQQPGGRTQGWPGSAYPWWSPDVLAAHPPSSWWASGHDTLNHGTLDIVNWRSWRKQQK